MLILLFFHKAIAFNDFLFKISQKNSPNCNFCKEIAESSNHVLFIFCFSFLFLFLWMWYYKFIWDNLVKENQDKEDTVLVFHFQILKSCLKCTTSFLTYLYLCVKYYIYVCKFQNKKPTFVLIGIGRHDIYILFEKQLEYWVIYWSRKCNPLTTFWKVEIWSLFSYEVVKYVCTFPCIIVIDCNFFK